MVQFTKTPFPMVVARTAAGAWQLDAPAQNRRYTFRGAPPGRIIWFQLSHALSGTSLPKQWLWHHADANWRLENSGTGESLEGYFNP